MGTLTRGREAQIQLDAFATTLEAAGFRVYRPGGTWTFLGFAREVDGAWCSATVQLADDGGWSWSMRIVPSQEDGSSMFLDSVPDALGLDVGKATAVTLPSAINSVLSRRRDNAGWPAHWTNG